MVRLQMDQAWFKNVSNLDLIEPNQIKDLKYACIKWLFANFF